MFRTRKSDGAQLRKSPKPNGSVNQFGKLNAEQEARVADKKFTIEIEHAANDSEREQQRLGLVRAGSNHPNSSNKIDTLHQDFFNHSDKKTISPFFERSLNQQIVLNNPAQSQNAEVVLAQNQSTANIAGSSPSSENLNRNGTTALLRLGSVQSQQNNRQPTYTTIGGK